MMLLTKTGKKIDASIYLERVKTNILLGRDVFEQTPIGEKANGDFFWWDEEKNPTLDKRSVRDMIKAVKQMVVTEKKGKISP